MRKNKLIPNFISNNFNLASVISKFNKNKILYTSLIILIFLFIIGSYLAYVKYQNKSKKIIANNKPSSILVDDKFAKKDWSWVSTTLENSQIIKPRVMEFVIKFNMDGTFTSTTDCNNLSGKFSAFNGTIKFEKIITTEKYCMKSLEGVYIKELENAKTYKFNDKGQLIIELKDNSGFILFK